MSKIRNMKLRYKIGAGVAAGAAIFAGAGAAFAYFTSTGTGSGSGTVGSATNWGVSSTTAQNDSSYTAMYPGVAATDQTVTVSITNNGKGNQELNSFVISVANQSDGTQWQPAKNANFSSEDACSAADFALGGQTAAGSFTVSAIADDLAPGATYTKTVNLHMLDTNVPQDNCQGITVPLYISAS